MVSSSFAPSLLLSSLLLVHALLQVQGFSVTPTVHYGPPQSVVLKKTAPLKTRHHRPTTLLASPLMVTSTGSDTKATRRSPTTQQTTQQLVASLVLVTALALSPLNMPNAANAMESDYASDTVQTAITKLTDAAGNPDRTFDAYENIAEIIAEGKGIGGNVDYKGVTLDRGFISDEDTSIYNPGLTLLTESEKERIVESLIQSRKAGIDKNEWNEKNQSAYSYLKFQLDPLHMTELKGYLKVAPFLAGVLYLGVLAVQQLARELFPTAYIAAVVVIVAPAAVLVLTAQ